MHFLILLCLYIVDPLHSRYGRTDRGSTENYKKQIEQMKSYILDNTTIDEKTFNKNRNKDWYLSSDELLKYGVIDEVITDLTLII